MPFCQGYISQRERRELRALASVGHTLVTRPRATLRTTVHGISMISALTVVPRPERRPEIAVLDGHERDGRIDGASVCIDGLDLGSCTDAPRSFQKLLRREGKELGLKTLADNFGFFWASVIWV
ncbi:hypothetical protein CXB51_002207 [Gossypium anomalum]|uniref:Uncharacterized protein n=1 Tax=Gossypium anomalum TaxID=47600 RepID=A0A8J5Z8Y1_9ROSI|nr:hypothetical protein CXB51_002207 [Gossypium anomalum]